MNPSRRFIPLLVLALMSIAAPSFAATALVWGTGNGGGSTQGVANYLAQYGCFSSVTATDADLVALATLNTYDAVLYFSNASGSQDPTSIGDVLADYADTGRRLVLATFAWAQQGSNTLGGRIITDQISPLLSNGGSVYTNVSMASNDGSALFTGVASVLGFYHDNVVVTPGALQRALWSDGFPLVATKGNVVAVNLFPDDFWLNIGGDYQQLFANAMCASTGTTPVAANTWGRVKTLYR